jgi:cytochrome c556
MKSMGEASKTLAAMFKGETAYSKDKVRELSALIRKHASEMTELFPKGSDRHPSEAKATIWTDWKGFVAASKRLREATLHLQDAAKNEPAALTAFIRVGKSCKGCHRDYRVKGE